MAESWERLVERWTAEGLIDAASAARIRAFEGANAGSNRLKWPIWIALAFGVVTLGAGALLFVAAHWDTLSPAVRFELVPPGRAVGEPRVGAAVRRDPMRQAEKLEPQPQVVVAFGFLITNCAPCRSSL